MAPDGQMYRCHADLYEGKKPIATVEEPDEALEHRFRQCDQYGYCNPCDWKVKNDRQERFGHCAVEVVDLVDSVDEEKDN